MLGGTERRGDEGGGEGTEWAESKSGRDGFESGVVSTLDIPNNESKTLTENKEMMIGNSNIQ